MRAALTDSRFPLPSIRRSIEQARDLSGYMVWPGELDDHIVAVADEFSGLCWNQTPGPAAEGTIPRTWLACLRPAVHEGGCGWERPLAMRASVLR